MSRIAGKTGRPQALGSNNLASEASASSLPPPPTPLAHASSGAYPAFLGASIKYSSLVGRRESKQIGEWGATSTAIALLASDDDDTNASLLPKLRPPNTFQPKATNSQRSASAAPTFLTGTHHTATASSSPGMGCSSDPVKALINDKRGAYSSSALALRTNSQNSRASTKQQRPHHLATPLSTPSTLARKKSPGLCSVMSDSVGKRNQEDSAILVAVFDSPSNTDDLHRAEALLKRALQHNNNNNNNAAKQRHPQQQATTQQRGVTFVEENGFEQLHAEEGDDLNAFLDRLGKEVERFEAASQERRMRLMNNGENASKVDEAPLEESGASTEDSGIFSNGGRRGGSSVGYRMRSSAVSFVSNADVEKQLGALLALEGLELDSSSNEAELIGWSEETLRHGAGRSSRKPATSTGDIRVVSVAQALDLLSLRAVQAATLRIAPSDRAAAAEKLKVKVANVQRRLSLQDTKTHTTVLDGMISTNASAGGNKYLLLNKAARNEVGEAKRKGPTLIERTMMASASAQRAKLLEAVNKSGLMSASPTEAGDPDELRLSSDTSGGRLVYHNPHVSHDGITERSLLLKKIEILRMHRPLRLQFLQHIAEVKGARMGMGRVGNGDDSIQLRNISSIHKSSPHEAEESRRAFFQKKWERVSEARERRNEHDAAKHRRFLEMVERARKTGLDYDTGIEIPDDMKYVHGSLLNDQAATFFLAICLAASQRQFTTRARKIMIERREREVLAQWKRSMEDKATKVQRWWRLAYSRHRKQKLADASSAIVDFLRRLPKIQVRFRLAMRDLIFRVAKLQRHFRSMFEVRRRRHIVNKQQMDRAINGECDRLQNSVQSLVRDRKKAETQLGSAPKARKPQFHNQIKAINQSISEVRRRIEFLLALSEKSREIMLNSILKPKERLYTSASKEYGARLGEKYLAVRNPNMLVEIKTGQRTMGGMLTTTEQRLVDRVMHTPVPRPYVSLIVTDDEIFGQLEEQGVKLGEVDFLEATLESARGGRRGSMSSSVAGKSGSVEA